MTGALGILTEADVRVPMRDGVRLEAHVFRPDAGGPFPAILHRTPYGRSKGGYERYVRTGYAVVSMDSPGPLRLRGRLGALHCGAHGGRRGRVRLGGVAGGAALVRRPGRHPRGLVRRLDAVAAGPAAAAAPGGDVRLHHPPGADRGRLAGRLPAGAAHQVVVHLHGAGPAPPEGTAAAAHAGRGPAGVGRGRRRVPLGRVPALARPAAAPAAGVGGVRPGLARAPEPPALAPRRGPRGGGGPEPRLQRLVRPLQRLHAAPAAHAAPGPHRAGAVPDEADRRPLEPPGPRQPLRGRRRLRTPGPARPARPDRPLVRPLAQGRRQRRRP